MRKAAPVPMGILFNQGAPGRLPLGTGEGSLSEPGAPRWLASAGTTNQPASAGERSSAPPGLQDCAPTTGQALFSKNVDNSFFFNGLQAPIICILFAAISYSVFKCHYRPVLPGAVFRRRRALRLKSSVLRNLEFKFLITLILP
jgi:hypothetical protein